MTIASIQFFLFVLVATYIYHSLALKHRAKYLLFISYLFYLSWDIKYAALMSLVTIFVYFTALKIKTAQSDKDNGKLVKLAVGILVLLLAFYKSYHFIQGSLSQLSHLVGLNFLSFPSKIILPLGLSYYIFKSINYLVDIYLNKIDPETNFINLANYISFFPQSVCGPIQKAQDFLPQIKNLSEVSPDLLVSGFRLILFGAFKKLVVADRLFEEIDTLFVYTNSANGAHAYWLIAYFYTIQLYADFSAATDISIGVARLFGIQSPKNFNNPFYAPNIQEFWRRWHMTLTSWLSAYVFTPLWLRLRYFGKFGLCFAILTNMLLIGMWHGTHLQFLYFGLIQGALICVSTLTLEFRNKFFNRHKTLNALRKYIGPLITFHMVVVSFVFIQASSLPAALLIIKNFLICLRSLLLDLNLYEFIAKIFKVGLYKSHLARIFISLVLMETVHLAQSNLALKQKYLSAPLFLRWAAYYFLIIFIVFLSNFIDRPFVYNLF